MKIDQEGNRMNWLLVKHLRFKKEEPRKIFVKYSFNEEDFRSIQVSGNVHHRRKSLPNIENLYWQPCPISAAKKKDLKALCDSLIIEPKHHAFYTNLRVENEARNCLPEPDIMESDQDTDVE